MIAGFARKWWFCFVSTFVATWLSWPSLVAFVRVALSRLNEGYALWWLEPLFYRVALASHQGLPWYAAPSLEFTPPIYNPGFSAIGGALIAVFGEGYPALRWFSFLCFVVLAVLIAAWSWRETRSVALCVIALIVTVTLQTPMGRWITAINVDTPSLCFGIAGLYVATRASITTPYTIAAGLLLTLGFAFKQPACLLALPALTHLLLNDRKQALWFALACAGSALLMVVVLSIASRGWYWTYAFTIPMQTHKRVVANLWHVMIDHHRLSALTSLIAAPLLTWLGPPRLRGLWLPLIAATWLMAYAGFTKDGGDVNTLLPAYVGGTLCLVMLPSCRLPLLNVTSSRAPLLTSLWSMTLALLVVIGAGMWSRDKMQWFRDRSAELRHEVSLIGDQARPPTYAREAAFEHKLRMTIARLPKPVFVGGRFFGTRGPLNTHQTGLYEGSSRTHLFDLDTLIGPTLASHHYKSMILWSYWYDDAFDAQIKRHYVRQRMLGADPIIGLHVHVWLPKPAPR